MVVTIFKKDMRLFFKDKKAVILTFLIPILLISLFAMAFGGISSGNTKVKHYKILFSDNDESMASKALIKDLDSLKNFTLTPVGFNEGKEKIRKGERLALLVFNKGFEEQVEKNQKVNLELYYDVTRKLDVDIMSSFLYQFTMHKYGKTILKDRVTKQFETVLGDNDHLKHRLLDNFEVANQAPVQIRTKSMVKEKSTKENPGLVQAVSGTAIMMLLFSIAGIGAGILEEKESGTLKRLLYAPMNPRAIIMGKMLVAFVLSVIQLLVMFVFTWLVFGLNISKDIVSLLVLIFSIAFAVSGVGIFLTSVVKSRQQLNGFSTIVIMALSALGGSMIPFYMMPDFMQKIAIISPNYWGIQGFFDIFWRELSFVEILPRVAVLIGMGLFMMLVSLPLFKKNILKFH